MAKKYNVLSLVIILLISQPSFSRMAAPDIQNIPLNRIIDNLELAIKEKPREPDLKFQIARVWAMAYARNTDKMANLDAEVSYTSLKTEKPIYIPWIGETIYSQKVIPPQGNDAALRLKTAVSYYESGLALQPNDIMGLLGLGWCYQEKSRVENDTGAKAAAIKTLDKAFKIAYTNMKYFVPEIGQYLLQVLDEKKDAKKISDIKKKMAEIKPQPRPMSPIIIPLSEKDTDFSSLTDKAPGVVFDLDGTGAKKWKWINPNAGWLVYTHGEEITSGLQMFGNVTFWIFWENGYEALNSLDDNRDKILTDKELDGLAIWNDRNSNGISEKDEIISLSDLNIVGIDTEYTITKNNIPTSAKGIHLKNGSTLPSYDFFSSQAE